MYLLDTNILSNLVKRTPSPALIARLAVVPLREQFTSSITVGELIYSALKARDRQEYWIEQIERRLLPNVQILPFDSASAYQYAAVRVELQRKGTPLDARDRQEYWIEQIERRLLPNVQILPFDSASAYQYAAVRVELQRKGTPLDDTDVRIAAIAFANNMTLVTDNLRHFQCVPNLITENWLT